MKVNVILTADEAAKAIADRLSTSLVCSSIPGFTAGDVSVTIHQEPVKTFFPEYLQLGPVTLKSREVFLLGSEVSRNGGFSNKIANIKSLRNIIPGLGLLDGKLAIESPEFAELFFLNFLGSS